MRSLKFGYADETRLIDLGTGRIARVSHSGHPIYMGSADWKATGAVRLNNFGRVVETLSLAEFAEMVAFNPSALRHKNGAMRWHLTDVDHGTARIQMGPAPKWVIAI